MATLVNDKTITSAGLAPVPTIQTVPKPVDTVNYPAITGGVTESIISDYTNLNNRLNNAQQSQTGTAQSILDAMSELTGKTAYSQNANEAAGVNTETANLNRYAQQLADLNAQATSLNREAQAIPLQVQEQNRNTGATDRGVAPQEAGALRLNALRALSIGQQSDIAAAAATGSQLRLQAAKDKAQQIVDLKYKPLEEALAIKQKQYELNKDILTSIDKKRTEALTVSLNKEAKDLEEAKAKEKAIQDILTTAGIQQAPQDLLARAQKAKTPSEAAMILGQYAGDYYAIEKMKLELNKLRGETTGGGDGGGTGSGVGREVVAGVPVESPAYSWLDQYNAGAMSLEDIYTKIGSSKTAEVTKNNLSKLIAAQGGKRVLKMDDTQIAAVNDQIKNINDLLGTSGYNYKVISGASQGGALGVGGRITGAKGDALAMARNLVTNQTLNSLAEAKAKGITFGALSEAELNTVASAASRIAAKIIRNEAGEVTGFSGSEKGFKDDLLDVKKGLEKSIITKTGSPVNKQVDLADKALTGASVDTSNGGYIFK